MGICLQRKIDQFGQQLSRYSIWSTRFESTWLWNFMFLFTAHTHRHTHSSGNANDAYIFEPWNHDCIQKTIVYIIKVVWDADDMNPIYNRIPLLKQRKIVYIISPEINYLFIWIFFFSATKWLFFIYENITIPMVAYDSLMRKALHLMEHLHRTLAPTHEFVYAYRM